LSHAFLTNKDETHSVWRQLLREHGGTSSNKVRGWPIIGMRELASLTQQSQFKLD